MFDINTISVRYYDIKLGELELKLEPPTKKMLTKVTSLSALKEEDTVEALYEATNMVLNKNKTKTKVSKETTDALNIDQVNGILTAYFGWIGKTQNSKN